MREGKHDDSRGARRRRLRHSHRRSMRWPFPWTWTARRSGFHDDQLARADDARRVQRHVAGADVGSAGGSRGVRACAAWPYCPTAPSGVYAAWPFLPCGGECWTKPHASLDLGDGARADQVEPQAGRSDSLASCSARSRRPRADAGGGGATSGIVMASARNNGTWQRPRPIESRKLKHRRCVFS